MIITTKDTAGNVNGALIPLWNVNQSPELRPEQVYLTTVFPYSRKGPHLHNTRRGMFACIQGRVRVRLWDMVSDEYRDTYLWLGADPLVIPPGTPCAFYNYGPDTAMIINMPAPAWDKDNQDEHAVLNWVDPVDWPMCLLVSHGGTK
jgi:dTDP-4-dehydrorhamnose 3,5-epimerase-like enzyme